MGLQGTAGGSAVFDSIDRARVPELRQPRQFDLRLAQPLYTGGRVGAQVLQAEALVAAERPGLHAPVHDPARHYNATRGRWQGLGPAP